MSEKSKELLKQMADKARQIDNHEAYMQKVRENYQKKPKAIKRYERMSGMNDHQNRDSEQKINKS